MRKILVLMLMFISVFALVACQDEIDLTISAPTGVAISDEGVLSWTAVSGVDHYLVYIDQRSIQVEGTSLDLTTQNILVGERFISVVAVKDEKQSLPSTVVPYTVVALSDPAVIIDGVLEILDPSYTSANMTRADFSNDWDYEEYQDMLRMTEAYALATSSINMTEANALGFFTELDEMMTAPEPPQNLSALMTEMEMLDTYNINAYSAANIIYQLLLVSLEMRYEDELEYEWGNAEQTLEILDALEENSIVTIQSLEIVLDFLLTFKDALSTNVIGLLDDAIDGTELSVSEIIIIKDEVVGILQDTMPSVTDIEFLYSALMYITGSITGDDMSGYMVHTDFLAEVDHLVITIGLEFIASIDAQTVEELEVILDGWMWYDEYGYGTPDPVKTVDLVLYVMTYIDEFKTENSALFDDYDALMEDDANEALFIMAIDQIILQLEDDPYVDEMAIEMLEAYKAEYDTIRAAMDIFANMGENVIQEFITSEAELFYAIIEMSQSSGMAMSMIDALINDLLPLVIPYNTAIFADLDQEAILTLLEFLQIPVTAALIGSVGEFGGEMELPNFDSILPDVASILADVIVLEQAILDAVVDADIETIMANQNLDPEIASMLSVIVVLDLTLSSANEAIIYSIIDTIFDDILKDADMMELHGLALTDIDTMKTMIEGQADEFITEVQAIADFNFNTLTYDQEERILAIGQMIQMLLSGFAGSDDNGNTIGPVDFEMIYVGTTTVNYTDSRVWFIFQPTVSGMYTFHSNSLTGADPYITIYDADMNELADDDDSFGDWNFYTAQFFVQGMIYYLEVGSYDSYTQFDVIITYAS
jgi:hypothetical protein